MHGVVWLQVVHNQCYCVLCIDVCCIWHNITLEQAKASSGVPTTQQGTANCDYRFLNVAVGGTNGYFPNGDGALIDSHYSNEIAVSVQEDGSLYWTYVSCYQVPLFQPTFLFYCIV